MGVLAEFAFETPVFRSAVRTAPDAEVTLEQETITDSLGATWILRVEGNFAGFERGLDGDPTVRDYAVLSKVEGRRQYRVTLSQRGAELTIYPCWADVGGVFVAGRRRAGTEENWHVRFQFPDRNAVQEFLECSERRPDVEATLERLVDEDATGDSPYGLTRPQVETLVTAAEEGYFEVPRRITLPELADLLGVSDAAASERLRRGLDTLVGNTLLSDLDADHSGADG